MKGVTALLLLLSITTIVVDAQPAYVCPDVGSGAVTISKSNIKVGAYQSNNRLCTIVRHLATGKGKGKRIGRKQVNVTASGRERIPVARSYAAINGWEVSAGKLSTEVSIDCTNVETSGECNINLPNAERGEEYVLETFERPALSNENEASRFLEQSTFGPTRDGINALVASGLNYEAWVDEQMSMPVSSFREYYRKRANPKYEFPWFHGAVGAGPCDLNSRWRKYAVSFFIFALIILVYCDCSYSYEFMAYHSLSHFYV